MKMTNPELGAFASVHKTRQWCKTAGSIFGFKVLQMPRSLGQDYLLALNH